MRALTVDTPMTRRVKTDYTDPAWMAAVRRCPFPRWAKTLDRIMTCLGWAASAGTVLWILLHLIGG